MNMLRTRGERIYLSQKKDGCIILFFLLLSRNFNHLQNCKHWGSFYLDPMCVFITLVIEWQFNMKL